MTIAQLPGAFGAPEIDDPRLYSDPSVETGVNIGVGNYADRVGDARVDGLIGRSWSAGEITYSDPNSPSDYGPNYPVPILSVSRLSTDQLRAVQYALDQESHVAGGPRSGWFSVEAFTTTNFTYRPGAVGDAVLRFANSSEPDTSWSFMPSPGDVRGGDSFFGGTGQFPVQGTSDYHTVLLAAGHSLGLKFAHEADGWGPVSSAYDSLETTVMSFRSYVGAVIGEYTNELFGMPQTFMMGDIRALQQMYGADFSTNSTATTYSWNPATGDTLVNGELSLDPGANRIFMTIWDGGGYDTYDLSNYDSDLQIDLTPGGSSKFLDLQIAALGDGNYAKGNVYNALQYQGDARSLIEAAIGGSGDDVILGNAAQNALEGRGGNDELWGGANNDWLDGGSGNDMLDGGTGGDDLNGGSGNDHLDGGSGDDVMMGRAGNDRYEVDSLSDFLLEFANEGVDTVESLVVHTLGENFENLVLIGSVATGGTGNGVANQINGSEFANTLRGLGGADRLYGAGGDDFLRGGDGSDRLSGGAGSDILMAGRGADVFDFDVAIHSDPDGNDIVRAADGGLAFDGAGRAAGDRIDLSGIDANIHRSGNQAFVFDSLSTGGLWFLEQGSNTVIRGTIQDGQGFEFELVIEDGSVRASAYTAADFIL